MTHTVAVLIATIGVLLSSAVIMVINIADDIKAHRAIQRRLALRRTTE